MAGKSTRRIAQVGAGLTAGALAVGAAFALPADAPLGPRTASGAERLIRFDDCEELTSWYVEQALPKVTAWGFGHQYPLMFAMEDSMRTAAAGSAPVPADDAVGSSDTGTNVQEAGVDEPDIAKLMDRYVVSVESHDLVVTDVSGPDPAEVSRLELPAAGWSYELLVVGDRVLILGTSQSYGDWFPDDVVMSPMRLAAPLYMGAEAARSSLTTVDLSDPASPDVVNRDVIEGQIETAREHDGTIRIVATTTPTPDLDFVTPYGPLTRAEAREKNRELVAESTADDWMPARWPGNRAGVSEPLVDCADVTHPASAAGLGTIAVITLDPEDPASLDTAAISADGSVVYASADHLYVSTAEDGWEWEGTDDSYDGTTEIHAFSTVGDTTAYVASGEVEGSVSSQWSFSAYDGNLRVASTVGKSWNPTETIVTVLEERDDRLVSVGTVGGLGPDEEVKAVRWFGDYAVVVTFRQVDPLYLLNLSDPTDPTVVDELKVPGFSQYLHPVGDGILLGIGQVAANAGKGMQASTFELSDLRRLDQVEFRDATYSSTGPDARSFTYLPDQHIALFPTDSWRFRAGASLQVVAVGTDGELTVVDEIELGHGAWAGVRTLPLDGGRVALVEGGSVTDLLDAVTPIR